MDTTNKNFFDSNKLYIKSLEDFKAKNPPYRKRNNQL